MRAVVLPASPIGSLRTLELGPAHETLLQSFFDANPEYFVTVNGEPAGPGEAREEIESELPAGWSFTKRWIIGYADGRGELAAMASVVTDLLATGVWQIGLFIVATARHGNGEARILHQGLQGFRERQLQRLLQILLLGVRIKSTQQNAGIRRESTAQ